MVGVAIVGLVKVLFVRVWVAAIPVNVSVTAGSVSVLVPATAGADMVIAPDVSPDTTIDDIFIPYKTTQR
jgi:hypothetical protein